MSFIIFLNILSLFLQKITSDVWWFYMISMAFHWSLTLTFFFEYKRKDFWMMFTHHIVTILLMKLAWVCNMHRMACVIVIIHNFSDVILELEKALTYAKLKRATNFCFCLFTLSWIVTRLIIFPLAIYAFTFQFYAPVFLV